MNLYLLTQDEASGYDTYDSCIVAAESEEDAKTIRADGEKITNKYKSYDTWASSADKVKAQLIGTATLEVVRGVVLASFNAG